MFDAAFTRQDVAADALAGLTAARKTLPPKLFYDEEGVRLFEAITQLPEYYLTRTERALLTGIAPEIAALAARRSALVEYGACEESKARLLLDARPAGRSPFAAYVPVDVADGALQAARDRLARSHPGLVVAPVCADFMQPVRLPALVSAMPAFGFFPGSTIGNMDPDQARHFLRIVRDALGRAAWLLVGADLRKDPSVLIPAYDDAQGVTAAFNLNLLRRLNREAAANFDLSAFRHRAEWNDAESRIEMHLVSMRPQTVRIAGEEIRFAAGETIHTENSYKHDLERFRLLAESAGWRSERVWTDARGLFSVHALRAPSEP